MYEHLLFEEESDSLDFKRRQYKFVAGTDNEKAELLKDILAFVNAWRRSDAFILTGVEEVKGAKSNVVGITEDIDDAALQQFVNGKTQKPVAFSYRTTQLEGKKVGVFHIPVQERPRYIKSDFGHVKSGVVYVRRGSSTAIATPDEIAEMGRSVLGQAGAPELVLQFARIEQRETINSPAQVDVVLLTVPKKADIPDFTERKAEPPFAIFDAFAPTARSGYYRDLVAYYYETSRATALGFSISNSSSTLGQGIKAEISIPKGHGVAIAYPDDLPDLPRSHDERMISLANQLRTFPSKEIVYDVHVKDLPKEWLVTVSFPKVQPKQTLFSKDEILIVAEKSCLVDCNVVIFADNLPDPIRTSLQLSVTAQTRDGSLPSIAEMHKSYLARKYGVEEADEE